MIGWKPKTSATGNLPNITHEPIKPKYHGTMFRNCCECLSGSSVNHDSVAMPEKQNQKKYYGQKSHFKKANADEKETIPTHVSEVLRQVDNANLPTDGTGWVGGDSWFGSVMAMVETKRRLGVESTFVIKQNKKFFPTDILQEVLFARYPSKRIGHWVVMKTVIHSVPILAIAYAWSSRGIAYFGSTVGDTGVDAKQYISKFEDDYGNTGWKHINRPKILTFIYEFLPLIDESNKQRQSILNLEQKWPTRNYWFRLLVGTVGINVVDFHRIWRNYIHKTTASEDIATRAELIAGIIPYGASARDLDVIRFSDLLTANLVIRTQLQAPILALENDKNIMEQLERITTSKGHYTYPTTVQQKNAHGRSTGSSVQQNCLLCRKYLNVNEKVSYMKTSFCCKICKIPLCKVDRSKLTSDNYLRTMSCLDEHLTTECTILGCNTMLIPSRIVPTSIQINYPTDSTKINKRGQKRKQSINKNIRNEIVRKEVTEKATKTKRNKRNDKIENNPTSESEISTSESDDDTSAQKTSGRFNRSGRKLRRRSLIKPATRLSPTPFKGKKTRGRPVKPRRR